MKSVRYQTNRKRSSLWWTITPLLPQLELREGPLHRMTVRHPTNRKKSFLQPSTALLLRQLELREDPSRLITSDCEPNYNFYLRQAASSAITCSKILGWLRPPMNYGQRRRQIWHVVGLRNAC
jgi:hypothetical protein